MSANVPRRKSKAPSNDIIALVWRLAKVVKSRRAHRWRNRRPRWMEAVDLESRHVVYSSLSAIKFRDNNGYVGVYQMRRSL